MATFKSCHEDNNVPLLLVQKDKIKEVFFVFFFLSLFLSTFFISIYTYI